MKAMILGLGLCFALAGAALANPVGYTDVNGGTDLSMAGGPGRSAALAGVATGATASTVTGPAGSTSNGASFTIGGGVTRGNAAYQVDGVSNFDAGSRVVTSHHHHD